MLVCLALTQSKIETFLLICNVFYTASLLPPEYSALLMLKKLGKKGKEKTCFITIPYLLKGKAGNVYHSAIYREGNRSKLKPKSRNSICHRLLNTCFSLAPWNLLGGQCKTCGREALDVKTTSYIS